MAVGLGTDSQSLYVYDHAGDTFTLLGDSERAHHHSSFHPAKQIAGYPTGKINKIKATLNPEP